MPKANRPQTDNKFNEFRNCFSLLFHHEYLGNIRKKEEDISQKAMQHPRHANSGKPGEKKQSDNKRKKNKQDLKGKHII